MTLTQIKRQEMDSQVGLPTSESARSVPGDPNPKYYPHGNKPVGERLGAETEMDPGAQE